MKLFFNALLFTSSLAIAGEGIPYVAPKCNNMITHPGDMESTPLFNKECDTAFVMIPPRVDVVVSDNIGPNANLLKCKKIRMIERETEINLAHHSNLAEELSKERDPRKRAELMKEMAEVLKLIDTTFPIQDLEGFTLQVVLDPQVHKASVDRFITSNLPLWGKMMFVPAPIRQGMLSFGKKVGKPGDAIKSVDVPGITREGDELTVLGIGTKPALITYSLAGACPMLDFPGANADLSQLKLAKSTVNMVATYTYAVPVKVSKGYEARLAMKSFIEALVQHTKENGQFTLREFYDARIKATGNTLFYFKAEDLTFEARDPKFYGEVREAAFLRLSTKLMEQLKQAGAILEPRVIETPNAPAGGNVARQIGTIRKCSSSSFLGVTYSSDCWNEPWIVSEWVNGNSSGRSAQQINVDYVAEEQVLEESLQTQSHTTSFYVAGKE